MLPQYVPNPWAIAADRLDPTPDPYWDDPYGWIRTHIDFRPEEPGPAVYQAEVLGQLPHRRRIAVRAPHGTGKTTLAAWAILWFVATRDAAGVDWKVVTTASVWRQLEHYLWPEIRKWARRLVNVHFDVERALFLLKLDLYFGQAFAAASDKPSSIEGAHADHILYVLDEAKAIIPDTWDAVEGAFSTGDAYALAISTPGPPAGRFYDIHKRKPGYGDWWVRHITLDEAIAAGRIRQDWADARKLQWGEKSAVYQQRVLGNFAVQEENAVIPLAWLEAANIRHAEHHGKVPLDQFGLDVARGGEDNTVFAFRHRGFIEELEVHEDWADTMRTGDRAAEILKATKAIGTIDTNGVGAGVYDRLRREFPGRVVSYSGANRTVLRDFSGEYGFTNQRSAAYWTLREALDPSNEFLIGIPDDDELTGDLTSPTYEIAVGNRYKVEPKEKLMERIGRSPDKGDSVVMAYWPGEPENSLVVEPEQDTRVQISPM